MTDLDVFSESPVEAVSSAPDALHDDSLWPGDAGTLTLTGRRTLLQLVHGPFLDARRHSDLWKELLRNQQAIAARCNDLLLDLVVDVDRGIAFVRNATSPATELPKATRSITLTLLDTLLVLTLRRELLMSAEDRVVVDKDEILSSLGQYQPLERIDEAAFSKRLDRAWGKMRDNNIVLPLPDTPNRFEISPVLAIVFGTEEARAVAASIDELLESTLEQNAAAERDDASINRQRELLITELKKRNRS